MKAIAIYIRRDIDVAYKELDRKSCDIFILGPNGPENPGYPMSLMHPYAGHPERGTTWPGLYNVFPNRLCGGILETNPGRDYTVSLTLAITIQQVPDQTYYVSN